MIRHFKKVTSSLCLLILICLAAVLMWSRVFQQPLPVSLFNVLTSSMSPKIPAGSLVVVKDVEAKALKKGDVVTFSKNGETLTHRITAIKNQQYTTKGDRNELTDYLPVEAREIKGKVILSVPYLGRFGEIVQTPRGMIALTLTVTQLLLLIEILTLMGEIHAEKREKVRMINNQDKSRQRRLLKNERLV